MGLNHLPAETGSSFHLCVQVPSVLNSILLLLVPGCLRLSLQGWREGAQETSGAFYSLATRCQVDFMRRRPAGEGGAKTWSRGQPSSCSERCRRKQGAKKGNTWGQRNSHPWGASEQVSDPSQKSQAYFGQVLHPKL